MRAFISYSHRDFEALNRLHAHLSSLRRAGLLQTWYDREIIAGENLEQEIDDQISNANVFLLIVSPDFIASNYCVEKEMKRALEKQKNGTARVIPIILEPCDWKSIPELSQLKALPRDGRPISEWENENSAYLDVVNELHRVIPKPLD